MDYIPDRLVQPVKKAAAPMAETATSNGKIDHALGRLGAAGMANGAAQPATQTSQSAHSSVHTIYSEKITHVTDKLSQAGMGGSPMNMKSSSGLATKWIIIIAAAVGVAVLAVAVGGFFLFRRYRRRKAYAVVSRGADGQPQFMKGKGKGSMDEKEEMFNADRDLPDTSIHADEGRMSMTGPSIGERNFENGYDSVDTGYNGSGYSDVPKHGDKRAGAGYEA